MKEFCKIFIVDGVQILFRKGIIHTSKGDRLMIFINVFMVNPLQNGVDSQEIPIPCCCVKCQNNKFNQTDQSKAEIVYREVILKMKNENFIYQDHHKN